MASPLRLNFVQSAARLDQLPASTREVAIVGRSNVGKSSLVNALAHRKQLARTSKTPGATKLINVFELDPEGSGRWLVDLPGYGFAKVSANERQRWQTMIETYLTQRSTLEAVIVLIDGEIGPTPLDLQTVEWLHHIGRPLIYVATKEDKVRPSKRAPRREQLTTKLGVPKSEVTWVSAEKGTGISELRGQLLALLTT